MKNFLITMLSFIFISTAFSYSVFQIEFWNDTLNLNDTRVVTMILTDDELQPVSNEKFNIEFNETWYAEISQVYDCQEASGREVCWAIKEENAWAAGLYIFKIKTFDKSASWLKIKIIPENENLTPKEITFNIWNSYSEIKEEYVPTLDSIESWNNDELSLYALMVSLMTIILWTLYFVSKKRTI